MAASEAAPFLQTVALSAAMHQYPPCESSEVGQLLLCVPQENTLLLFSGT
jgi:hypothetical protein